MLAGRHDPREFIDTIKPAAQACHAATGIPASFTIAQAALESGWGTSALTANGKNLFGIKADSSWGGDRIEMRTAEYVGGQKVMESAYFRAYPDWQGSIDDHAKFLQDNKRYKPAFAYTTGAEWARAVADAGYATDPSYASKLIGIIDTYKLDELDVPTAAPISESQPTIVNEAKPMAPFIAAILPSLLSAAPELLKIFGSGSEVAQRNAKAAEIVVEAATRATESVNAQQAVERIMSDPEARAAFQNEIKAVWFQLGEAGSGGIDGARKADAERMSMGKPLWASATFVMGALLLPLVYMIVGSVAFNLGAVWEPAVRASIATGVVSLVLGSIGGYYFGASRNAGVGTPLPGRG